MHLKVKMRVVIQSTLCVKLSQTHHSACQIGCVPLTVSSSSNEMDMGLLESSLRSLGDERRELRSGPNTSKSSSRSFEKGPPRAADVCSQFTNCSHGYTKDSTACQQPVHQCPFKATEPAGKAPSGDWEGD